MRTRLHFFAAGLVSLSGCGDFGFSTEPHPIGQGVAALTASVAVAPPGAASAWSIQTIRDTTVLASGRRIILATGTASRLRRLALARQVRDAAMSRASLYGARMAIRVVPRLASPERRVAFLPMSTEEQPLCNVLYQQALAAGAEATRLLDEAYHLMGLMLSDWCTTEECTADLSMRFYAKLDEAAAANELAESSLAQWQSSCISVN